MAGKKRTVAVLVLMLLFYSVWLLLKGFYGEEAQRANALNLLWVTTPVGILLIIAPWIRQKWLKKVSLRFFQLQNYRLLALAAIAAVILLDVLCFYLTDSERFNDEGSFLYATRMLVEQGEQAFFTNYSDIPWLGKQHPPIPVLMVGYLARLFNGYVFPVSRGMAGLLGLGIAGCTYLIAAQLYDRKTAFLSIILLFGIRQFYLANIITGNDIYVAFFLTLVVLLLLKQEALSQKLSSSVVFWASAGGICLSLAVLSKYTGVLGYLLLPALLIWPFAGGLPAEKVQLHIKERLRWGMPRFLIMGLASLPLLGIWFWYLYQYGHLSQNAAKIAYYLGTEVEVGADSVSSIESHYLSNWRIHFIAEAIVRKIPIAIGVYNLPLIALGFLAWVRRERERGKDLWENRLVLYWIAVVVLPILITLPVSRYFMPAYPALAILMAHGLSEAHLQSGRIALMAFILSLCSAAIYF